MKGANGATELRLSPSMEYLADPATEYPVTVDPDIAKVQQRGDTYYWENQPSNDTRGTDYRLRTGEEGGNSYRSLVTWAYEDYVGQTVTDATLKLHQYSSETCTVKESHFVPMTAEPPGDLYWANQPTFSNSARYRSEKTYNHGQSPGCPDTIEEIDVTAIVSAWAGGQVDGDTQGNNRQGIVMKAEDENDASQEKRYCSANLSGGGSTPECNSSSKVPVLSVTYAAELGDESFYSMTKHPLNGTSSLAVNNRTGNAFVSANDASVNARGVPFALSRSYNSQAPETTSMGRGWNISLGADVWLEKRSKYRYDFHSPDGTVFGSFVRKSADEGASNYDNFNSPLGGVGADLDQDPADDRFILTMRDSQAKYRFTEFGPDGHAYLTRITDRSGNAMNLTYSGTTSDGLPKLSSVTDAGGRTYTVAYDGDYISTVTEDDGLERVWTYEYTDDFLTSYTDPAGKTTDYTYDTGFTGPDLLKSITNPANQTGERPTTNLTYGLDDNLNVDQVVTVGYVLNDETTYQYSFEYHESENATPVCEDHGDFSTEVTDPNAAITTHCFKPRDSAGGKAKDWIYDGEERERTKDFNADRQSEIMSEGVTGSTVATYASATPDQLETVKEPDSDAGRTGARTNVDYDHSGGGNSDPKGGKYLPGSVTDPNGDCVRYEYDSEGRATASITDLRGSGTERSCATASGGAKHAFTYNSDGTIAKSTDPNAGASPTDADRTIYTYWASGDAGFVAGSAGLVKSVREPGGNCSTTTAERKLCESYTYDAAGRALSVTNGKNEKTTMQYDVIDRTTGVFFGGATQCNFLFNNDCITYTYDAEGNLTQRAESNANTTFTYDRLNRQLTHTQPGSIVMEMSYDGPGNMTGYTQKVGAKTDTTTYAYDRGNIVDSVTDAAGTINVNTNDGDGDPYIEEYIFPGSQGIKIDLDVKDNGKTESAEVLANQGSGSTLYKIAYDYTDGTNDEDQMQSRTTSSAGSDLNGTIDYEYEFGRLATATDSSTAGPDFDYTHDEIGNVTSERKASDTTHYGYDRAGQLCWRGPTDGPDVSSGCSSTPTGNTTLNQDAAGNNTNTSGGATSYNNRDQATSLGGLAMSYRDLGNDLRTKAGDTSFVDGPLGITGTYTTDLFGNTTVTWYTRMPDGTILNSRKGAVTQDYFTEPHNGSVAALYSPAGARTATYTYSPYGETSASGTAADANPFRYISGYQDTAGPEDYYKLGARYYDGHGHFTQPDPLAGTISDPRTMTAYNYGNGDPINNSDPTGLIDIPSPEELLKNALKVIDITQAIAKCAPTLLDRYGGLANVDCQAAVVGLMVGGVTTAGCIYGSAGLGTPVCIGLGFVAGELSTQGTYAYHRWLESQGLGLN